MISFMQFVEAVGGLTIDRSIVVQRVGPTPPNVAPEGGISVWFWDSPDGLSKNGPLKVSYPVTQVEFQRREGDYANIRIHCAFDKVYATKMPFQAAVDLDRKVDQAEAQKSLQRGPEKVGTARRNQIRQAG